MLSEICFYQRVSAQDRARQTTATNKFFTTIAALLLDFTLSILSKNACNQLCTSKELDKHGLQSEYQ